ncbi:MAG TPA: alkaline phosphatase family protein [Candidatus Sulfotelmatobacter sp.]|nr:alkaline phosphatase family protein [Candidatus Sulfotelmatobacter sp.]
MKLRLSIALFVAISSSLALSQISRFQHIVIIVQENRTPDNLFQELCGPTRSLCPKPYDLQNFGINSAGQQVTLVSVPLGTNYDLGHTHPAFKAMCDLDTATNQCRMDRADKTGCSPAANCPLNSQFAYVRSSDIGPYLFLARNYGWANYMFQTNQGPSAPAHQFLFSGTSARSAGDDYNATFIAENPNSSPAGCLAPLNDIYRLISPQTANTEYVLLNNPLGTFCLSHPTMGSLLEDHKLTWKYYTPGPNSIWTAPNFIRDICMPDSTYTTCTGSRWKNSVDLVPKDVLTDISACKLANVSWVIPTGQNSDHAGNNQIGGPSWVASIINALGTSTACDGGTGYWKNTAIFLTWDDWGGWYDHVPPVLLSLPGQGHGNYQYGFRVPLLVISAYTPAGYVNNRIQDFGSILRFVEFNFGIPQGALKFADNRAINNLTGFFNLAAFPRPYQIIAAPIAASTFLNDNSPMDPPDDD